MNLLQAIGNTSLVRLSKIVPPNCAQVFVKEQARRMPGEIPPTATRLAEGGTVGPEASLGKVFWSELDIAMHETAALLLVCEHRE